MKLGPDGARPESAPKNKGLIVHDTIPYKVLGRLRKCGALTYVELSAYIAGVRMLSRAKYIDPTLQSLRKRGFIAASKHEGRGFRWTITPAGRVAMRDALPSVRSVQREARLRQARNEEAHAAHVERQRRAGIPEALIHAPLDFQTPQTRKLQD